MELVLLILLKDLLREQDPGAGQEECGLMTLKNGARTGIMGI